MSAVDKELSARLPKTDFLGARFKDDYRFLCKTKADASNILRILQECLQEYNLSINETKTTIEICPISLYRAHAIEYANHSLKELEEIPFDLFERTYFKVIEINERYK